MIKKYIKGKLIEYSSLLEALNLELAQLESAYPKVQIEGQKRRNPVISVIGAGGKTTTITRLAFEYRKRHIPVIVTTTTHMKIEDAPWFLLEPSIEKAVEVLNQEGMVWAGIPTEDGKMKAPPDWFLAQLLQCGCPVLIEADGAKRLPMKAPAEHEPVLLKETTHVLNICGLDAVGSPFQEVCFRPALAAGILGKQITDRVCPEDILNLALSAKAGKKGITPDMKYSIILNKADTREREHMAATICSQAVMQGMAELLVTALQ